MSDTYLPRIRAAIGYIYVFIITLLFLVRIPYYREFTSGFNQFIFNTFRDDTRALFYSSLHYLLLGVILIIPICFLLYKVLKRWLDTKVFDFPTFSKPYYMVGFLIFILLFSYTFWRFVRFGGALTENSVRWTNAAKTNQLLLNEAILDDFQALYRAYDTHEVLANAKNLDLSPGKVAEFGRMLSGSVTKSNHLDDYLRKSAQGAKLPKPKHIFLIVAESYSQWPLMPTYENLDIASGLKSIANKDDAEYLTSFLSNGNFTIGAVSGIVTGLSEVKVYPNYQEKSLTESYSTALAPQMQKLGYRTNFLYGGYGSWQNVEKFSLAQGFEKFVSCGDLISPDGNTWGIDDGVFLRYVLSKMSDDQPTFNMILTVSNHPPYTVDLDKAGFFNTTTYHNFPDAIKQNAEMVKMLGHFWYCDKVITEFVETVKAKYPDSLFIITGDHVGGNLRYLSNPTLFERYAIPLIIYGKGVNKGILPANASGAQINIGPTLIELIAPKGFIYYSLGESLTKGKALGVNLDTWMYGSYLGMYNDSHYERAPLAADDDVKPDLEEIKNTTNAIRGISWWSVMKGNKLD
jgi:phosphoglycerol transferase MdoB-like AlkP superfamily enzyme